MSLICFYLLIRLSTIDTLSRLLNVFSESMVWYVTLITIPISTIAMKSPIKSLSLNMVLSPLVLLISYMVSFLELARLDLRIKGL